MQAAADRLSPHIIRQQLDHWTWVVGPKFSRNDRKAMNLSRHYSLQPVEDCRNFVFRRNSPIHKLYERFCDLGFSASPPLFVLFHQRIGGPLANSLFHRKPTPSHTPTTKLQAAHQKADASLQQIVDLLAA